MDQRHSLRVSFPAPFVEMDHDLADGPSLDRPSATGGAGWADVGDHLDGESAGTSPEVVGDPLEQLVVVVDHHHQLIGR